MNASLVELREFTEDLEATVRPLLSKRSNEFVINLPAKPGTMLTDPVMVRQILLNLLSNAAKFTDHGTVTLDVKRIRVGSADWLEFNVTDTGIGIAPSVLPKLFSSFAQASASTAAKFGGTGIGLAVSRKFCTLLGGQISVTSELGKGSKFTVRLPAAFAAETVSAAAEDVEHFPAQDAIAA